MKVLVAGSRSFKDYDLLTKVLYEWHIEEIVSGEANGADKLGSKYGFENGIKVTPFIPDWKGLGNRAGYERNVLMANYLDKDEDIAIIFWDGKSNGSKHMIDICNKKGIEVKVYIFEVETCKHINRDVDDFDIPFCVDCGQEIEEDY